MLSILDKMWLADIYNSNMNINSGKATTIGRIRSHFLNGNDIRLASPAGDHFDLGYGIKTRMTSAQITEFVARI